MATLKLVGNQIVMNDSSTMDRSRFSARTEGNSVIIESNDPRNRQKWTVVVGDSVGGTVRSSIGALFGAVNALSGAGLPDDAYVANALKAKPEIVALVSPSDDFADLEEATAAVKAIVDALKA